MADRTDDVDVGLALRLKRGAAGVPKLRASLEALGDEMALYLDKLWIIGRVLEVILQAGDSAEVVPKGFPLGGTSTQTSCWSQATAFHQRHLPIPSRRCRRAPRRTA